MGFSSVMEILQAIDDGKTWTGMWRRTAPSMAATTHMDCSYGGGGPPANYYASAPFMWQTLSQYDGISHGPDAPGGEKFIHRIWALGALAATGPLQLILCDYLAYCPFLDGDEIAEQTLPDYVLPRYADGAGVQVMLVIQGAGVSNAYVEMRYLNQDGLECLTPLYLNSAAMANSAGSIATSINASGNTYGIFMRLNLGDTGVRAVKGIRLNASTGAVFAVVLVKPICTIHTKDNSITPFEIDFLRTGFKMPKILNGAYLNFIGRSQLNATPHNIAELNFVWP